MKSPTGQLTVGSVMAISTEYQTCDGEINSPYAPLVIKLFSTVVIIF